MYKKDTPPPPIGAFWTVPRWCYEQPFKVAPLPRWSKVELRRTARRHELTTDVSEITPLVRICWEHTAGLWDVSWTRNRRRFFCPHLCRTWRLRMHWLNLPQKKRAFFFITLKDSNLDYSFETGMVYPPEGLFYIEMDQAAPGKFKGSHCLFLYIRGGESKKHILLSPLAAIMLRNICNKADISTNAMQVLVKRYNGQVLSAELPQWLCPGMHSAIHLPIT